MRIVFLCTSSLDYPSPRGRWLPVAGEMARAGHAPHLLMLHPTFEQVGQIAGERLDGVQYRYVGQMHVHGLPGQRRAPGAAELARLSLRGAYALAAEALRLRPDVVVAAKPQPINGLAALLVQRASGCRLHVDCDDYEAGANRFASAWQRRVVALWEDGLPRRASSITVNTRFLGARLAALGISRDRVGYVPNGLAAAQFAQPDQRQVAALRGALGLGDAPTLAYLGSMSTVAHGVGLLLEAVAVAARRLPRLRLLMIGDGDDRPALMRQARELGLAEVVRWLGRVPQTATAAYLACAHASIDPVFDTPAMAARSPLKVVESMARAIPVITSDVGDRREVLAGEGGVLVAPGDVHALADGISGLLGNTDMCRRRGLAARKRADAYRWERLVAPWLALLER